MDASWQAMRQIRSRRSDSWILVLRLRDGVSRVNLFRQQGALSAAIRLLGSTIPNLSELGLPEAVNQFSSWNKGIILVTGETGSGKSTTLAAILNEINQNRPIHMITLEDPIEYVYEPAQAIINQREVGVDVESYDKGLYAALREDRMSF